MSDTVWICPKCEEVNTDDEELTVFPMCNDCQKEFEWSQIAKDETL